MKSERSGIQQCVSEHKKTGCITKGQTEIMEWRRKREGSKGMTKVKVWLMLRGLTISSSFGNGGLSFSIKEKGNGLHLLLVRLRAALLDF